MNIFEKMELAASKIATVQKDMSVSVTKTSSYKAVSEKAILDAVKPIEAEVGIYSYPFSRKIIDSATLTKESTYNGQTSKTNSQFMRIETVYRFVNTEKPDEYIDQTTYGDGIDTGDKAPGKAMTYSDKYALMKAYKISTGDDPDAEASPEKGYERTSKTQPKQTEPTPPPSALDFARARLNEKVRALKAKTGTTMAEIKQKLLDSCALKDAETVEDYEAMIAFAEMWLASDSYEGKD